MPTGTEGTSTTVAESSTIADEIGALFGDVSTAYDESPETETHQDEGATPASESAPASDSPASPEGAPNAEHAGEPPAVAAAAASDDDPLDGATPFPYTVDGDSRTFDGITVLKSGGAIVAPDALPKLQQRLSERDHLFEQGRKDYQRYADLERLTTWSTKDEQGNAVTLMGQQGLEARVVSHARAMATLQTIAEAFASDESFARLATTRVDEQGNVFLVRNPDAVALLKERMDNAAYRAEQTSRSNLAKASAAPPPETPIADMAAPTVEQYITQYAIQGLTPEDKTFLAGQLPRYITQHNGQRAVDPVFLDVMKDRASLRQSTAASAQAATTAAQENARRLAAASAGKRPVAVAPVTQKPVQKPAQDQDALWAMLERTAR